MVEWKIRNATKEAVERKIPRMPKEIYIRHTDVDFIKSMSKFGYVAYPVNGQFVVLKKENEGPKGA